MAGWSHTKSTAENNNNNNNNSNNNNNNNESYLGHFLLNGYPATGTCGAFSAKHVSTERQGTEGLKLKLAVGVCV